MIFSGQLHHAYCLEGDREYLCQTLFDSLEKQYSIVRKGNPDFWLGEFETFGIPESRLLKERAQNKAFGGGKKIFVISFQKITREAQNSLLKILEEPTAETHFFLIATNAQILLPTLRSRLAFIKVGQKNLPNDLTEATRFLSSSPAKRMEIVKDIIENKDKERAEKLLNQIENQISKNLDVKSKSSKEELEEIMAFQSYLNDRSPSIKLILEHLSCAFEMKLAREKRLG